MVSIAVSGDMQHGTACKYNNVFDTDHLKSYRDALRIGTYRDPVNREICYSQAVII